jgi:hypothetical protein
VTTYTPATDGALHQWIAANGRPGAVLMLPPGAYDLTAPIHINGFTLAGSDPRQPTTIRPRGHGLIWAGQPRWSYDLAAYKQGLELWTKPPGAPMAMFDATETPLARPLHRYRRITISLDLDTPGGVIEPGGLFNFGPVWCWWHPQAPRGPEMFVNLGAKPFDPDSPPPVRCTWTRPTLTDRTTLVWTIDLTEGRITLTCNGLPMGERSIPPRQFFPAINNVRATIGSAQEEPNGIRGRWMLPGGVPDRRIRGFEVTADNRSIARIAINSEWQLSVTSPDGSGPLYPVPYDPAVYRFVDGLTRVENLVIRPAERFKAGIRVGQIMGRCEFRNIAVYNAAVGVRKLPGLVSYDHYIDGLTTEYSPTITGHGMTIRASDWTIRYPATHAVSLGDSNLSLERWTAVANAKDEPNNDLQAAFDFAPIGNGGTLSLRDGMWNDESGVVAYGSWLYFKAGSSQTSSARLTVQDCAINVPSSAPTYRLDSVAPHRAAAARIFATHWGAPVFHAASNWSVDGPERPASPGAVTP